MDITARIIYHPLIIQGFQAFNSLDIFMMLCLTKDYSDSN